MPGNINLSNGNNNNCKHFYLKGGFLMSDSRSYEEIVEDAKDKQINAIKELSKDHSPKLKEKIIDSIKDRAEMIHYIEKNLMK